MNIEFKKELSWLNENFINAILNNEEEKNFVIKDYQCELASQTGENYSSTLYRLKINLSTNGENYQKSYIVKCMLSPDTDMGKLLKDFGIFRRESAMYGEALPNIENVLKTIGSDHRIAPKLLHMTTDLHEILVIEDLQISGYQLTDRLKGMDLKHSQMVFTMLAKMHAASMYLNKQNPQFRRNFNEGCFTENLPEVMENYFKNGISQATEVMRQLPNCRKYVTTFESFYKRFVEDGKELQKPVPENYFGFNVLNHGDIWLNNIMFKYNDSNEPIDVKFIDFQMSNFGCPGIDINYFFFTSPAEKIRNNYREELLVLYHSTLVEILQKLKYDSPIPSLKDLHKALARAKDIAIMTPCIVLPLVKLDKEKSMSTTTDDIMNEDSSSSSRQKLYDNELYHKALEVALKHLEYIGFI